MKALLDANALIALAWPAHEHHAAIHRWFAGNARRGWVTTPLTEAAFIRVLSQPAFSGSRVGPLEAIELLTKNLDHPRHSFLPMDVSAAEVAAACTGGLVGHRQVSDAYLLALAVKHECTLVTFDTGVRQLLASDREREIRLHVLG